MEVILARVLDKSGGRHHLKVVNGDGQQRHRRPGVYPGHTVGFRTENMKRMTPSVLARIKAENELEAGYWRPKTRGECVDGPRPCLYLACKFNLYVDVSPRTGSIKYNHPTIEPDEMVESCALDIADRGGARLEDVALALGIVRERVRQIEDKALKKLWAAGARLREWIR